MTQTKKLTTFAILVALLLLLASTPLGFIPIPPLNPTIMHIPVIIGAIILGPVYGASLGFIFGVISLVRATILALPSSFVFSPLIPVIGTKNGDWRAVIIAILPRVLIGVVSYYVYQLLKKHKSFAAVAAGVAGSLTNTILVMNLIYIIFKEPYAELIGKSANVLYGAILTVVFTNGLFEAICAGILTVLIVNVYQKVIK